jgi:hypothetical protein
MKFLTAGISRSINVNFFTNLAGTCTFERASRVSRANWDKVNDHSFLTEYECERSIKITRKIGDFPDFCRNFLSILISTILVRFLKLKIKF